MMFTLLVCTGLLIATFIGACGLKVLLNKNWFLAWLKGCFGFSLIALALLVALMSWQFNAFSELTREQNLANISFIQLQDQSFRATLTHTDGSSKEYLLRGDMWQLDARIIQWQPWLMQMGFLPAFQLDRLSGRYFALEDEQGKTRTVYDLSPVQTVSIWQLMSDYERYLPWLDTQYGNGAFMPMIDGGLYAVNLSHSGLTAEPLNKRAKEARTNWQ